MNTAQPIIIKDHNYPFYKIYNIQYLLFVTFWKGYGNASKQDQ